MLQGALQWFAGRCILLVGPPQAYAPVVSASDSRGRAFCLATYHVMLHFPRSTKYCRLQTAASRVQHRLQQLISAADISSSQAANLLHCCGQLLPSLLPVLSSAWIQREARHGLQVFTGNGRTRHRLGVQQSTAPIAFAFPSSTTNLELLCLLLWFSHDPPYHPGLAASASRPGRCRRQA